MESKPYSPTRNPIARAIHCIVIAAIVIILMMWTSDYVNLVIDIKAAERQRSEQLADSRRAPYSASITCQRPGTGHIASSRK